MKRLVKSIFLLSVFILPNVVFAASFDCSKASRTQDKMICANADLSQADTQLAELYEQALQNASDKDALKQVQINWLKIRDACKNTKCMLQAYQSRINALQKVQDNNAMASLTNASAQQNMAGKYPVWISPELGVNSLSEQDINSALAKKFWNNPAYQQAFKEQINYLKAHQNDQDLPVSCDAIQELIKQKKIVDDGYNIQTNGVPDLFDEDLFLPKVQADCQAIRLLRHAKPASKSAVRDFVITGKLLNYLPIIAIPDIGWCSNGTGIVNYEPDTQTYQLFKSTDRTLAWNSSMDVTSSQKEAKFNYLTPYSANYSLGDNNSFADGINTINFYLLAKGDFTGDGWEEILLEVTSSTGWYEKDSKTLYLSSLFLLVRQQPTSVLQALYPERYGFIDKIKNNDKKIQMNGNSVVPLLYFQNRVRCDSRFYWLLDKNA